MMVIYCSEQGIVRPPTIPVSSEVATEQPAVYTLCGDNEQYGNETLLSAGLSIKEVVSAWKEMNTKGSLRYDYYTLREWKYGTCVRYVTYINKPDVDDINKALKERYGN